MIKKDLPGRTLDFTFDLSTTPVIGQRVENPVEHGKENKLLSPVTTVDLSGWRKPHLSQVHLTNYVSVIMTGSRSFIVAQNVYSSSFSL